MRLKSIKPANITASQSASGWVWIWAMVSCSIIICAILYTQQHTQKNRMQRISKLAQEFGYARNDLAEGFLHFTLGNTPESPWQREQGLALLNQALNSYKTASAALNPHTTSSQVFQHQLETFRNLLLASTQLDHQKEQSSSLELRLAMSHLIDNAAAIDRDTRAEIQKLSAEQDSRLTLTLSLSAIILLGMCIGTYREVRRYMRERKRKDLFRSEQNTILQSIASGTPLNDVMEATVQLVESQLPDMICSILLLDETGQYFYHGVSSSLPTTYIQAIQSIKIGPNTGSCGTAAYERKMVIVEDIANDTHWEKFRDMAEMYNLRACWSVPFFSNAGTVMGTFAVYANQPRTPRQEDLLLIQSVANMVSITIEREMTNRTLFSSQAMVQATFASAGVGIAIANVEGKLLMANPTYCEMLGYTKTELSEQNFISITHPDDQDDYRTKLDELLVGNINNCVLENRFLRKDNTTIWMKVSLSVIREKDGKPTNITAVTEDITMARQAREALRQSQALLAIASQVAHMGGWSISVPEMRLTFSDEASAIHGEPPGFAPSVEEALNYTAPEYREVMNKILNTCVNDGLSFDEELELITRKGKRIWVRTIGEAVRNAEGVIAKVQGALIDINEQKKTEQEKLKTLNRLQRIASRLPGMIYELRQHPDGGFSIPYASDSIRNIFHVNPEDVIHDATPAFAYLHPADRDGYNVSIQASATSLMPWQHEYRLRYADDRIIWLRDNALPQRESDGSILWHGFITDITESRKSQEQLKLLETCVARLNDIVLITEAAPFEEPGPHMVFVNDAFVQRTGYSREEALGRSPRMLQGPKTQRTELDRIKAAMQQWQPVRAELINYAKNGDEYWLELDIVPIADHNDHYTHWIAVERDITERKLAEIELARLNRALMMRSTLSEFIVHASNETVLLNQACQLAIDISGYCSAWVGFALNDTFQTVKPEVVLGSGIGHLQENSVSWSENRPEGLGPVGCTIRNGTSFICEDFSKADFFKPWLASASKYGLTGVVSLPLRDQQKTFGALVFYLSEVRTIGAEEIMLLEAMADDLAFGIVSLRTRDAERRTQTAILKVAASVSAENEITFFGQLMRNMLEALNADGAFIARLSPIDPLKASTISAIFLGEIKPNFDYLIADSPCKTLLEQDECIIHQNFSDDFPTFPCSQASLVQGYIGRGLRNTAGEFIGFIFLLFREPLNHVAFISSTLKIFATRAAAELERQSADTRIRQQASLLDKAQDAILVRGLDHTILFWNKSAERLYGWTAAEATHAAIDELMYEDPADFNRAKNYLMAHGEWNGEIRQRRKDGSTITIEGRWTLLRDDANNPQSILAINTDITARKAAQEKILHLAFYDSLTKLANRQLLTDRLKQTIAASARNHKISALLFIDLDNFKELNDTLGHSIGDELLIEVASRLSDCVRECDTVSRLGGDEFVVTVTELSDALDEAAEQARSIAEKVLNVLNETYNLSGHAHHSTPSIGITLINEQSKDVDELLKQADLAMYQAKAAGRNAIRFYNEAMQTAITKRVALEADLRQGLKNKEFLLHYQPQLNHNGAVTGAEALIRWMHPKRGLVPPAQFIPLAEETRLILPIGLWVLETACNQLLVWAKNPETAALILAVNVSAYQFRQQNFVQQVLSVLEKSGVSPYKLKLELTESLLLDSIEDTIEKMTALKAQGISFSLDDFGIGYSSLSYLKRLPLDQLKIDQTFVRDVLIDPNDASIARTIVTLGQSLGLEVIAEGVETEAQRSFLLQNNCYAYQGYLFSRPLPINQFENYLLNKQHNFSDSTLQ